jgi:uncharacterized repeat protein (TIGR01451 family)
VATTGGAGTWAVVVKNTGDVPITSISSAVLPTGSCQPSSLTFNRFQRTQVKQQLQQDLQHQVVPWEIHTLFR